MGLDSSYTPLEIHNAWKGHKVDKVEPPTHTEYFLSSGATTLIFKFEASAMSSFVIR